jgi:hypothetical protein
VSDVIILESTQPLCEIYKDINCSDVTTRDAGDINSNKYKQLYPAGLRFEMYFCHFIERAKIFTEQHSLRRFRHEVLKRSVLCNLLTACTDFVRRSLHTFVFVIEF